MQSFAVSRISTISFLRTGCFVLLLSSLALGQTRRASTAPNDLKMTVSVDGQSYCAIAKDTWTTVLHLGLTFTNTSNHPVIVARRFTSAPGSVAKSADAAARGEFEVKPVPIDQHSFPAMSPWALGPKPPSLFETLKPGDSFQATFDFPVLTSAAGSAGGPQSIAPGEHVLVFRVDTWPYPGAGAQGIKNLQKRWRRFGRLSAETVEAEPVTFTVPSQVRPRACVTKRPRLPGWTIEEQ